MRGVLYRIGGQTESDQGRERGALTPDVRSRSVTLKSHLVDHPLVMPLHPPEAFGHSVGPKPLHDGVQRVVAAELTDNEDVLPRRAPRRDCDARLKFLLPPANEIRRVRSAIVGYMICVRQHLESSPLCTQRRAGLPGGWHAFPLYSAALQAVEAQRDVALGPDHLAVKSVHLGNTSGVVRCLHEKVVLDVRVESDRRVRSLVVSPKDGQIARAVVYHGCEPFYLARSRDSIRPFQTLPCTRRTQIGHMILSVFATCGSRTA
eukprot:1182258-Prorocentrum_minimum.AAC.1